MFFFFTHTCARASEAKGNKKEGQQQQQTMSREPESHRDGPMGAGWSTSNAAELGASALCQAHPAISVCGGGASCKNSAPASTVCPDGRWQQEATTTHGLLLLLTGSLAAPTDDGTEDTLLSRGTRELLTS